MPKCRWVEAEDGDVPDDAVKAGSDVTGDVYVGRAGHNGQMVPGKVIPSHKCCYIPIDGLEVPKTSYEVLTDNHCIHTWKACTRDGAIPKGAITGGWDEHDMITFVCRSTAPDGCPCAGKYVPETLKSYIPWGGKEHESDNLEFCCKQ